MKHQVLHSTDCRLAQPTATQDRSALPDWVPGEVRLYLEHTLLGKSMRALARDHGGHASTILRQVRKQEGKRDDPLIDAALNQLGWKLTDTCSSDLKGFHTMMHATNFPRVTDTLGIEKEARRILRRLCESSAFLIVAEGVEKAAVMRETEPGNPIRIAVVGREFVQAFALKEWIECFRRGKILSYRITTVGRAALKRILATDPAKSADPGLAEVPTPFQEQHKDWQTRRVQDGPGKPRKRMRFNLAESPLTILGRRKGNDGQPFLAADLVQAGERLREDFEMAQMGPRITQNWDRFLTSGRTGGYQPSNGPAEGPMEARERVAIALRDLGPGLGDIALRCCCFLEGMETAEKRMGWSARSGKIVLRIALQRLKQHYEAATGTLSQKIG